MRDHIINEENAPPVPLLAITESWLKPYISDAQVSLEGYNCIRADRPSRKGGGCLLYVAETLLFTDSFSHSDKYCNMLYCFIDSMNTLTSIIYRPPDAPLDSFKEALGHLQSKLDECSASRKTPDIYIMGDFNLPEIDWESPDSADCPTVAEQQAAKLLLDFIDRNFLTQAVCQPTRGGNTIDLVLTNKSQDIIETSVIDTQMSDHKLVQLTLGYNPLKPTVHQPPPIDQHSFRAVNFHQADFDTMNRQISEIDWSALKQLCEDDEDGSDFLDLITLTVLQITLINSPKKPVEHSRGENKKSQQCRERYILKRRRRKMNARLRALQERNPSSPIVAQLARDVNLLTFEISELIIRQLNEKEAKAVSTIKSNPRYFYSYAKRHAKTKSSVAPIRDNNGTLKTGSKEKAELLQAQYIKVFSDPSSANVENCLNGLNPAPHKDLDTISFGADDIAEAIKELDPYSATPDGDIPAKVLVKCKDSLAVPIFLLWKDSFESGIRPP